MIIKSAVFTISNSNAINCPTTNMPEYAFIGRSNVGKSSLINYLVNNSGLAKTSSTPGKTQLINHFLINEKWFIVDLPGYGYAKVSKKSRSIFSALIEQYILNRENLISLFVLLDSRLEPQKIDITFMEWLGENSIPFSIVFTKIDKLSSSEFSKNLQRYKTEMLKTWDSLPPIFTSSTLSKNGRDEILNYIEKTNDSLKDQF